MSQLVAISGGNGSLCKGWCTCSTTGASCRDTVQKGKMCHPTPKLLASTQKTRADVTWFGNAWHAVQ